MYANKEKCRVFSADEYETHVTAIEESECFYFPAMTLKELLPKDLLASDLVLRAARLEIMDNTEAAPHAHPGATIAYVASGSGMLISTDEQLHAKQGDWMYVPPNISHVNVAEKGTVMVLQIIYLGAPKDLQTHI